MKLITLRSRSIIYTDRAEGIGKFPIAFVRRLHVVSARSLVIITV